MNAILNRIKRAFAHDFLTVVPPEYYILVLEHSLDYVRVGRGGSLEVLHSLDSTGKESEDFERFCRELRDHATYYGQALRILLHNHRTFTYFKALDKVSPAQLLDQVKTIVSPDQVTLQRSIETGSRRVFALQVFDKEYLKRVRAAVEGSGLAVTDILTLDAFLLATPLFHGPGASTALCEFPDNAALYTVATASGDILVGSVPEALRIKSSDELMTELEHVFHFGNTSAKSHHVCEPSKTMASELTTKPLGKLFRMGPSAQRLIRAMSLKAATSSTARILAVTLNSARLLASFMVGLALLVALTAGVVAVRSATVEEPLEEYQKLYSEKLGIEREVNELKEELRDVKREQGNSRITATLVSSFCQRSYPELFLTEIEVRYSGTDSVHVDARGMTTRESAAFSLRDDLAETLRPYAVTINSLRPRQSIGRGAVDSLFTFGISVAIP